MILKKDASNLLLSWCYSLREIKPASERFKARIYTGVIKGVYTQGLMGPAIPDSEKKKKPEVDPNKEVVCSGGEHSPDNPSCHPHYFNVADPTTKRRTDK